MLRNLKLWIFGAPGSGVTTLGQGVALRLGLPFFDTDDYYWFTADALPYRRKRNPQHRLQLLERELAACEGYVVAGALLGWGEAIAERFDFAVYRWLPAALRLQRIRQREVLRYGAARLAPGGELHLVLEKFLRWAEQYDEAPLDRLRGRAAEERWLAAHSHIPVLRLFEDEPVETLADTVCNVLLHR